MEYLYKFHIGDEGEQLVAQVTRPSPLPDLVPGNEVVLTVHGWSQRIGQQLMIRRCRVSLTDLPNVQRYQVDVFCELMSV